MDSKSPGLAESFPTLLTLERLLFGVNISKSRDRKHNAMLFMFGCPRSPPTTVKVFVGTKEKRQSRDVVAEDCWFKSEEMEGSFGSVNKLDK